METGLMPQIRLYLFGHPRFERDGQTVEFKSRKGLALLAYLAATDRPHSRDRLAGLLWPEHSQARARANLRQTLYQINRSEVGDWVRAEDEAISLEERAKDRIDVLRFAAHWAGDHEDAWSKAASLYRDEFLAGFYLADSEPFAEWALLRREMYQEQALAAMERLAESALAGGDFKGAEAWSNRQLAIDPLRERAWRQLIEALLGGGQRGAALASYQRCRALLWEELGVEPAAETIALAASIQQDEPGPEEATPSTDRRALDILGDKVRSFWIEGVLSHSLHGAARIDLELESRPQAVDYPWRMVMEKPDSHPLPLPAGAQIGDVFAESGHSLLILGAPGSGKTTMLLELVREAIEDYDRDPAAPVPVVFNLASWSDRHGSLLDWLVDELSDKYLVPPRIGRAWLEQYRLMLCLDGLDEVSAPWRDPCVEAINRFLQNHGITPVALCSRAADYGALHARVKLNSAVHIQPLDRDQVEAYLHGGGARLRGVQAMLARDEKLLALARTPLMLNVIVLALADSPSSGSLPASGTGRKSGSIWNLYVKRMLGRRGEGGAYTAGQTLSWLSWLARQLQIQREAIFLIETMQPDWLSGAVLRWLYIFLSRFAAAFLVIHSYWLQYVLGLILYPATYAMSPGALRSALVMTLTATLAAGTALAVFDWHRFVNPRFYHLRLLTADPWDNIAKNVIAMLLVAGLFTGSFFTANAISGHAPAFQLDAQQSRLVLIATIVFGPRTLLRSSRGDIHRVEALSWSWRGALMGAVAGGSLSIAFWMAWRLFVEPVSWRGVATQVLPGIVLGGLLAGLSRGVRPLHHRPNQGMILSLRYGLLVGLALSIAYVLVDQPATWWMARVEGNDFYPSILEAPYFFVAVALWFGWLDLLHHGVLRALLALRGHIPWRYARFLDHAVDLLFLQRVGGGYQFVHPLLREHFAAGRSG